MQNLGEWVEYQFSRIDVDGPEVPRWPWLGLAAKGLFWLMAAALTLWTGWLIYRGIIAYLDQPSNFALLVDLMTAADS